MNTSVTAMVVLVDDGQLGADAKHRRAREALDGMRSQQHEWRVLLEDDAVPVVALLEQLDKALRVALPPVVSMYLGNGHSPHPRTTDSDSGSCR